MRIITVVVTRVGSLPQLYLNHIESMIYYWASILIVSDSLLLDNSVVSNVRHVKQS